MHYFCNGKCGGMSDEPGTCSNVECDKYGEALLACSCADGQGHQSVEMDSNEEDND